MLRYAAGKPWSFGTGSIVHYSCASRVETSGKAGLAEQGLPQRFVAERIASRKSARSAAWRGTLFEVVLKVRYEVFGRTAPVEQRRVSVPSCPTPYCEAFQGVPSPVLVSGSSFASVMMPHSVRARPSHSIPAGRRPAEGLYGFRLPPSADTPAVLQCLVTASPRRCPE
jgi:hypothetical protein